MVSGARILIAGTNRLAAAIEEKVGAAFMAVLFAFFTSLRQRAQGRGRHVAEFARNALRAARGSQLLDAVADA